MQIQQFDKKGGIFGNPFSLYSPEHQSCFDHPDSATSSIYACRGEFFPACLWCLVHILRLLHSDTPPRVSLVNLANSQRYIDGTLLMPPPSSLRFMLQLDWPSITGHAQWAPGPGMKLRADQFITELCFHQWTPPTWLIRRASTGLIAVPVPGNCATVGGKYIKRMIDKVNWEPSNYITTTCWSFRGFNIKYFGKRDVYLLWTWYFSQLVCLAKDLAAFWQEKSESRFQTDSEGWDE